MDISLSSPMDVDSNLAPTPEHPLLNHLIVTRMLKNLDTLDLVKCSEVNKLWFTEGRKLLKTGRCYAHCRDNRTCEDLKKLDTYVGKLTDPAECLYNGLYLPFDSYWHGKDSIGTSCLKDYDEVAGCCKPRNIRYNNILHQFPLKYLKINWYKDQPLPSCPAALLIPKLLLDHGQTLEEIELVDGPFWLDHWLYARKNLRNGTLWLPNLKVFKGKPMKVRAFSAEKIWKLVRAAPHLEELLVCVTSKDLRTGLAPPDRYNMIKSLCFEYLTNFDIQAYKKFVSTEPKLRCLVVKYSLGGYIDKNDSENGDTSSDDRLYYEDGDMDQDLFWEIFERLLRSSRESLEKVRFPVYVLAAELGSDWQVFPNVKELSVEIPLKEHEEELYTHEVLRQFDFRAKFPNLTSVTLFEKTHQRDHPSYDDEHYQNSIDEQPMLPLVYTAKISGLTLKNFVTDFGLAYSSSVFPHVMELDLTNSVSDTPIPYRTIWREFPNLEVLSVREGFWSHCVNYDAEFLGISKNEARGLQWMEPRDLKGLLIVPTKPGITTVKNLRQVTVNFLQNLTYRKSSRSKYFFLSPVACMLTVQRMPHLKFKVICSAGHEGVMDLLGVINVDFH